MRAGDAAGMSKLTAFALACAGACALALPAVASADETTCRGTIGATTVDNLRVPEGATCELQRTRVKGTVKVETDATLRAFGVRVVGNVQSENARKVVVRGGSRVGGSVQVKQGGSGKVLGSRVKGDIQFDHNSGKLKARNNTVVGSIQVVGNQGPSRIVANRVNGNLQCKENDPPPTGGGNVVQGNKEDQCAAL
jgi:hypothetical protein